MNRDSLVNMLESMQSSLFGKSIGRINHAVGSNLFIEIGEDVDLLVGKGKRKEWVIWISDSAWRITHNQLYVVGSGDHAHDIKIGIEKLQNKTVQNLFFSSDFLDLQIEFEDGYRLNTFFHSLSENQWTIFTPSSEELTADLSSFERIRTIQNIAKEFAKVQEYPLLEINLEKGIIETVFINELNELMIYFEKRRVIIITHAMWRLESKGEFLLGFAREETPYIEKIFQGLVDQQITKINSSDSSMDATFLIGTDVILRTFAFTRSINQWKLDRILFRANSDVGDLLV
jgi:hypothetical protein